MALEDNNAEKAVEEANKAVAMSPEALDAMAILATVDWLNDKPSARSAGRDSDHVAMDRQDPQDQSALRRSLRHRRTLLRHQSPLYEGIRVLPQGAGAGSGLCKARAASWASI